MKTVGVLGGMGPAATIDFFARVVAATPAARDQDHLRLIIDNNPQLPDRNEAIAGHGESPANAMALMGENLQRSGADLLVIACNTAHAFIDAVRTSVTIPVLDMVEETALLVRERYPTAERVGLLAADGCLAAQLYQSALERHGLSPLLLDPTRQSRFMGILYRVKAGHSPAGLAAEMKRLAMHLEAMGADMIVGACTEVPLLISAGDPTAPPLVNSTDALVAATIREATKIHEFSHA